jgi:glucosamine--fructose-6-phosphate aminotransferase (isomerizing)
MCGIIGYVGHRPAVPILLEGLKRLEYRGYDSAGVAYIQNNKLKIIKSEGKITSLEEKIYSFDPLHATLGIGHTRWATHGIPVEKNAHPHQDNEGKIALIHNGIIENYQELKEFLISHGYKFLSDTDTEVLVHLISHGYKKTNDPLEAIRYCLEQVDGSYAIGVIFLDKPDELWAARESSPLIIGVGVGENFIASDLPAFLPYTKDVIFLEDGEVARLDASSVEVFSRVDGTKIEKEVKTIPWDITLAQKGGFKHFMLKEIMEQPRVIQEALTGRVDFRAKKVVLQELDELFLPEKIHIVACGTSYHAGFWGKYLFERLARIPVEVDIASEFRYRSPIIGPKELVVVISQSGETADTLAGLRMVKKEGVTVLGICNVVGSSVARESDVVLFTQAGPEISVASTKAMCSQMIVILLMALYFGNKKRTISKQEWEHIIDGLNSLSNILKIELPRMRERAKELATKYSFAKSFFYLGRGVNYPLALEGALKLKEISYIHAEGYAAGEMKHGPIALIEPDFPSFVIAINDELFQKVVSNVKEIQARKGPVICVTHPHLDIKVDDRWEIPDMGEILTSFFVLSAEQLFAYEMAVYLGKDVDQPRNLAKSVTVE